MPVAVGVGVDETELLEMAAAARRRWWAWTWPRRSRPTMPTASSAGSTRRGKVVAIDLGMKRDILANLTSRGLRRGGGPGRDHGCAGAWPRARRCLRLEWPGRSRASGRDDRNTAGPAGKGPVVRDLSRPSAARPGSGRRHLQAAVRAPRRETTPYAVSKTAEWRSPPRTMGLRSTCGHGRAARPPRSPVWPGPNCCPKGRDRVRAPWSPPIRTSMTARLEGMQLGDLPAFSVQYHPESAPGPRDCTRALRRFRRVIEGSA